MTQEEKQLLLIDLCARIPYGVKVDVSGEEFDKYKYPYLLTAISKFGSDSLCKVYGYVFTPFGSPRIEDVKPYLRPMSSMTEEEKKELNKRFYNIGYFFTQEPPYDYGLMVQHPDIGSIIVSEFSEVYDWLNAHHFDFRNLIEKGLAIEAPNNMYNF